MEFSAWLKSQKERVDNALDRLLPKAEAKLRGEMPPELMYVCGGDRKFFRTHQIDPADFLRRVWKARGDYAEIITWVKQKG